MDYSLGISKEQAKELGKQAAIAYNRDTVILEIWNYEFQKHEYTWEFWDKWQTTSMPGWEEIHCIDADGRDYEGIPEDLKEYLEGCKP